MRNESRRHLRLSYVATAVVSILVLLLGGCFTLTQPALPRVRGSVSVEGLRDTVGIHRDKAGVPHIIASSDEDAFFAQGYVHAQDRFYQMEFWRRIGAGRLSELFGEGVLASDIYLRTMGFRRIAEEEYRTAPPLMKMALDSYAAGVNAYISTRKPGQLAAEFGFLGLTGVKVEVEPWTPADTLTWAKVMSQDLGYDFTYELMRLDIIRAVGIPMISDYFAPYRFAEHPTVLQPEDLAGLDMAPSTAPTIDSDLALFGNPEWLAAIGGLDLESDVFEGKYDVVELLGGRSPEFGSNQWAVSGEYTESGLPLFANDVHLGIQMPSIWYECSIHVTGEDGWNAHGYSFAGGPGIVIGHNDHMIWGMTTAFPDVQDLYVEQINPENPDEYLVGDEWVPMEIRQEVIQVNGAEPYFLEVRMTRNGPIVTDHGGEVPYSSYDVRPVELFPTNLRLTELSLRWTALEPTFTLMAVLKYDRATNFDEFKEALSYFHVPCHNYVYADVSGNIGYVQPARIPERGLGFGSLPAPGWDDAYQWQGYIPFDELPSVLNPEKGYVIANNNAVSPEGMARFSEHLYAPGFRAGRAEKLILSARADGPLSIDDFVDVQLDIHSSTAERFLPYVLGVGESTIQASIERHSRMLAPGADTDKEQRELEKLIETRIEGALEAKNRLSQWDLMMGTESVGASIYAQFFIDLAEKTYADQIPEDVWNGPWSVVSVSRLQNSIWLLLEDPENEWWDDMRSLSVRETRDDIIAIALGSTYEKLCEILGKNLNRWQWKRLHTATFQNATLGSSGIGLIENVFNRGPIAVDGGMNVLKRAGMDLLDPFGIDHIVSLRMVADLADWSTARYVMTPGNSGHPASPNYDNMMDDWAEGTYFAHPWTLEEIANQAQNRLILNPSE